MEDYTVPQPSSFVPPPLRTRSPPSAQYAQPFNPPPQQFRERSQREAQTGPSLGNMKWVVAISLIVAILGFYVWRHFKKPEPPAQPPSVQEVRQPMRNDGKDLSDHQLYLQSQQQEEMRQNLHTLQRQLQDLQQQQVVQVAQLQKYQTLEKSHMLLLNKVKELSLKRKPGAKPVSDSGPILPPPPE